MRVTAQPRTDAAGDLILGTDLPRTGLKAGRLGENANADIWGVEIVHWVTHSLRVLANDPQFGMLATHILTFNKKAQEQVQFGYKGPTKAIRLDSKEYRTRGAKGMVYSRDIDDPD
jgi:hypothetical protein